MGSQVLDDTFLRMRQGYLQIVDAIERAWGIEPRTAVCRQIVKQQIAQGLLQMPDSEAEARRGRQREV